MKLFGRFKPKEVSHKHSWKTDIVVSSRLGSGFKAKTCQICGAQPQAEIEALVGLTPEETKLYYALYSGYMRELASVKYGDGSLLRHSPWDDAYADGIEKGLIKKI